MNRVAAARSDLSPPTHGDVHAMMARLVLAGAAPRTKKNSQRPVWRGGKLRLLPSDAYQEWLAAFRIEPPLPARIQWEAEAYAKIPWRKRKGVPKPQTLFPAKPLRIDAVVYRARAVGDLTGFLDAIGDALESRAVIPNDKLIQSWGDSRLDKDATNPRVELFIRTIEENER